MKKLEDAIKRLKKLSVQPVLKKAEVKTFIIKLNRFNQIFIDGETVDGYNLGTYSYYTEQENRGRTFMFEGVSKQKIRLKNHFLLDTGRFFKSFKVEVDTEGFKIVADDSTGKGVPLEKRYGELVGLSEESKEKLLEFVKPYLLEEVHRLWQAS